MKQEDNKKSGTLDLGLAKLAGAPQPAGGTVGPANLGSPASVATSSYADLFAAGKLKELINLCERNTSAEPSLWWVKAQLALASMPVSIIAAPLESASQKVLALGASASSDLKLMASNLLLEAAASLTKAGDFDLARSFIDRAEQLGAVVTGQRQELARTAVSALEQLPRIPQARMEAYAEYKRIAGTEISSVEATSPREGRGLAELVRLIGSVLLILVLVYAGYYLYKSNWFSSSAPILGVPTQLDGLEPVLKPGENQRVVTLEHLDPMLYDLADKKATQSQVLEPKLPPKEDRSKLNLDGPIEPAAVREARNNPEISADPQTSVRTTDPYSSNPRNVFADSQGQATPVPSLAALMYQALVKTQVMSEPSYKGRIVAEIRRGDQVLVEGNEGNFYKIRSKRGQLGYVLRQDVEQVVP